MPVPIERKRKSSTPRATPCHCSPSAARLTSFSSQTGSPSRSLELAAERVALQPGDARRERDAAALRVDDAGHADDRAVEQRLVEARSGDERGAQLRELVEHALRRRCRRSRRRAARGRRREGRRSRRAGTGRRGRGRARAPPRARARRRPRRSAGRRARRTPRARARRRAATGAPATRWASRSRPGARSPPARSARPRGSPRAPCARSDA